jgi:hypothetical protein
MTEPPLPQAPTPQIEPASEWSQAVNRSRSENFSVMSLLVPRIHRAHFASVYAFCRVADDLADQTGSGPAARARSLELLARFRHEFTQTCQEHRPPAQPQWPELFARLAATMSECSLPLRPFHALLDAFPEAVCRLACVDAATLLGGGRIRVLGAAVPHLFFHLALQRLQARIEFALQRRRLAVVRKEREEAKGAVTSLI